MATVNIFCDPSGGVQSQSVRNDSGGDSGVIYGNCAAILGGIPSSATPNVNCGDLSVILMGDSNSVNTFIGSNSCFAFVGNGCQHIASGNFVNIFNGDTNYACGNYSTIGNGVSNIIGGSVIGALSADYAFIGGGKGNCIDTDTSTDNPFSFIGGGQNNYVCCGADHAVIVGGTNHRVNCPGTFIGGGDCNNARMFSAIAGGQCNNAYDCSAVAGGYQNRAEHSNTFIGGGDSNMISGKPGYPNCSAIVGGQDNTIGCNGVTAVYSDYSFIGGGCANQICSVAAVIAGGATNLITAGSDCSFVGGGTQNNVGAYGGAGAGSAFSVIGGGNKNCIDDTGAATTNAVIGGGLNNTICAGSLFSGIFGGTYHVAGGNNLFIGNGDTNIISSTLGPVSCSAIAGGNLNNISDDGTSTADNAFIGGGSNNNIASYGSSIVGGRGNKVSSIFGIVGGGVDNIVNAAADCSVIGGGYNNTQ